MKPVEFPDVLHHDLRRRCKPTAHDEAHSALETGTLFDDYVMFYIEFSLEIGQILMRIPTTIALRQLRCSLLNSYAVISEGMEFYHNSMQEQRPIANTSSAKRQPSWF